MVMYVDIQAFEHGFNKQGTVRTNALLAELTFHKRARINLTKEQAAHLARVLQDWVREVKPSA